jgi:GH43 family beta-xylosidase
MIKMIKGGELKTPRQANHSSCNVPSSIALYMLTVFLTCCVGSTSFSQVANAQDQIADQAAKARPLTAKELTAIYEGRTWPWEDGAAYFDARGRAFIAWSHSGTEAAYAEGSWSPSDQGRLCSNATWHGREGNGRKTICWENRSDEKNIFQRMLPDGKWYIIGHHPAQSDDVIQKLEAGDHASDGYQKNKTYLAEHKEQIGAVAAKARPLSAKELFSTYEDRTWPWGDGAAYFGARHRAFIAWSHSGAEASYAEGSWSASDQGRLCSDAMWHGRKGKARSTICWENRSDEKNIYQRKLPDGMWYVVGHLPAQPDDVIQKLQPGDHASEGYQKNKRYLAGHSRRRR